MTITNPVHGRPDSELARAPEFCDPRLLDSLDQEKYAASCLFIAPSHLWAWRAWKRRLQPEGTGSKSKLAGWRCRNVNEAYLARVDHRRCWW